MDFIMLIGVEGSGHGLIRSIFDTFLKQPTVVDQGMWHVLLTNIWDSHNNLWDIDINRYINLTKQTLLKYKHNNYKYCFDSASFPFGQPRDTLRRPDINILADILNVCDINFKPIFIDRNIKSAIYSGYRRGFTDNIILQTKIIKDNLDYINKHIVKYNHLKLQFENIILEPMGAIESISDYLHIDSTLLTKHIKDIKQTKTIIPISIEKQIV